MKPPKFLLCENPMLTGDYDGRSFILHNGDTKLMAEVYAFEAPFDEDEINNCKREFEIGSSLDYGDEYFVFGTIWVILGDKLIKKDAQRQANELAGIMRRMADWYKSYLIWEDDEQHM